MEDGISGDAAKRWFEENASDITHEVMVDEDETPTATMGKVLRDGGFTERSGHSFYGSGETDMYTGAERTECLHVSDAWTESELKELERIAKGGVE